MQYIFTPSEHSFISFAWTFMGWSCRCVSLSLHKNGPPLWVSLSENLSELLQMCCFNVKGACCDLRGQQSSQTILVHTWIWGEETLLWVKFCTIHSKHLRINWCEGKWDLKIMLSFTLWLTKAWPLTHWWLLCYRNSHSDPRLSCIVRLLSLAPEVVDER